MCKLNDFIIFYYMGYIFNGTQIGMMGIGIQQVWTVLIIAYNNYYTISILDDYFTRHLDITA